MPKIAITEKSRVHEEWFKGIDKLTLDTLPEFLRHLSEDYEHDYGTICHALAAAAVGACWAMNSSPAGGITGFQAGAVMWEFIKRWMRHDKEPMRLVNYSDLLYPQYAYKFAPTISPDVWQWTQEQARELLAEDNKHTHGDVLAHWHSIADGKVPFGLSVAESR